MISENRTLEGKVLAIAFICFLVLALVPMFAFPGTKAQEEQKFEKVGPRVDYLLIKIYMNPEAEALALKTGEIDLMDWPLPPEKVEEFKGLTDVKLYEFVDLGMFELDINNQRWPTNLTKFRQAIAYLVDKDRIVSEVVKGFGMRLDIPIPPVLSFWVNPNVKKYDYDPEMASKLLDELGFVDTDGDGIRNDPKTGKNMEPLVIYGRADDPRRAEVARMVAKELQAIGVPVDLRVIERKVCYQKVMIEYDYHLYTGGWSLSRDPDYLYDLWHSSMYWAPEPWSLNYVGFINSTYDHYVEIVKYGSDLSKIREAAFKAQEILAEQVPFIPLWSDVGIIPVRTGWASVVNEVGAGPRSWWTFFNAHPEDRPLGGTIKWGFKSDVETLNPYKAQWLWDWLVLDKIYDTLIAVNPYNLSQDMPWLATDWSIDTWTAPDGTKGLKLTFHLVKNATFHDGEPVTSKDVAFTITFLRDYNSPQWIAQVRNVVDVKTPDDYTVEVYLNTTSYWALHWIGGLPILPEHIWKNVKDPTTFEPDEVPHPTKPGMTCLIGSGPFVFVEHKKGEYMLLKANINYFRRHPGRTISISSVEVPESVTAGEEKTIRVKIADYLGNPVPNVTATLIVLRDGTEVTRVSLSHEGGGVYSAKVKLPEAGKYTLRVDASYTNPLGTFTRSVLFSVEAKAPFPWTTVIAAVVVVVVIIAVAVVYLRTKRRPTV